MTAPVRAPVLVSGGTGRLGRLVVAGLLARGQAVRVLTRQPEAARRLFGEAVAITRGDLSDPASLRGVADGVQRLFLLSPIDPQLVPQQVALIDEARRAGVARIVKLSGSDWTIAPRGRSVSGDAHGDVEHHLADSGIAHVSLRPNAWMQVVLGAALAGLRRGEPLRDGYGGAAVSFIDVRDIADVAVQQLVAPEVVAGPLVLTGAQAVSMPALARLAEATLGHTVTVLAPPGDALHTSALPPFVQRAHRQFATLIAAGVAAPVHHTVARLLGRAPRTVDAFVVEALGG